MTHTKTKTKKKCLKDPMYVIFFNSRGFKDFIYMRHWLSYGDEVDNEKEKDKDKEKDK